MFFFGAYIPFFDHIGGPLLPKLGYLSDFSSLSAGGLSGGWRFRFHFDDLLEIFLHNARGLAFAF